MFDKKERMMEGFLSLLIPAIGLLIAFAWGILIGLRRVRVRFICVALSFLIALIMAFVAKDVQYEDIVWNLGPYLQGAGQPAADIWDFVQNSEPLQKVLTASGGALISPAVFFGVFVGLSVASGVICYLVFIITGIINLALRRKRKRGPLRILLYTCLQVILTVFVLMTVSVSYLDCMPPVVNAVAKAGVLPEESEFADEVSVREVRSVIDTANRAPLTVIYRTLGGNSFCRSLTSFEVNGEKTTLYAELSSIADFAANLYLLSDGEITDYGDEEVRAMKNLSDCFEDSVILPTLAGEVIYGATDAWLDDDGDFIGVRKPALKGDQQEIFGEMFDHVLEIFHEDARRKEALCDDFDTLSGILRIMIREGVFADLSDPDGDVMARKLSNGTTVKQLIDEMERNRSFRVLIDDLTSVGMRAIGAYLQLPEIDEAVYAQFTGDIADAVNAVRDPSKPIEEQKAELTGHMREALAATETELEVDDSLLDLYSGVVLERLEEKDTITPDDVAELFRGFTEASADDAGN